jgi:hypothetical protein
MVSLFLLFFILILFGSRDVLAKPFKIKFELILREIRQICNEKMIGRLRLAS